MYFFLVSKTYNLQGQKKHNLDEHKKRFCQLTTKRWGHRVSHAKIGQSWKVSSKLRKVYPIRFQVCCWPVQLLVSAYILMSDDQEGPVPLAPDVSMKCSTEPTTHRVVSKWNEDVYTVECKPMPVYSTKTTGHKNTRRELRLDVFIVIWQCHFLCHLQFLLIFLG